jgi:hypothetical protein
MDLIGSNKIDYFIVCHDQDIINQQIDRNIFGALPNYKFLFVGNGKTNKLNLLDYETIICRNLIYNLEEYPYLCSFTAWYAVVKNGLYQNNNICLLEYDLDIFDNFHSSNLCYCPLNTSVVGYAHTLVHHYVFHKSTPWLEIALKKIHNIDLENLLETQLKHSMYWPISTNILLSSKTLDSFVDWFTPMAKLFKSDPLGSYVHERALFIYCMINGFEIKYNLHCSQHQQLASHNNADLYGAFLQKHNTKDFKEHMKMEYDQIYKQTLDSLL